MLTYHFGLEVVKIDGMNMRLDIIFCSMKTKMLSLQRLFERYLPWSFDHLVTAESTQSFTFWPGSMECLDTNVKFKLIAS